MTSHELEIYVNDIISYFCQHWELAEYYMQKASNILLQKFFQNKIVFIDTIGNPWACTKKSSCLIKGRVLFAKPVCTDHVFYCCITSPSWEMVTWLTPGGDEPCLLKPPILFLVLKSATPSARSKPASFLICMSVWVSAALAVAKRILLRKWKMLLAGHTECEYSSWHSFLRVLKISIRFRTTNPSCGSRDHISTESRT